MLSPGKSNPIGRWVTASSFDFISLISGQDEVQHPPAAETHQTIISTIFYFLQDKLHWLRVLFLSFFLFSLCRRFGRPLFSPASFPQTQHSWSNHRNYTDYTPDTPGDRLQKHLYKQKLKKKNTRPSCLVGLFVWFCMKRNLKKTNGSGFTWLLQLM